MRGLDVGDDQLHALHRARGGVGESFADGNRAARAGRCQLHEAQRLADALIVVGVKPSLLSVECLRAIHVRDGNSYQFKLPVHAASPPVWLIQPAGTTSAVARTTK